MQDLDETVLDYHFYFQWHITERCNSRCTHCYHESYSGESELIYDELNLVLDEMTRALKAWNWSGSISFTGGEPLIRREELQGLMSRVDDIEEFKYCDILTNGTLINDDDLTFFCKSRKLRRVQLSLESPDSQVNDSIRGQGSFDKCIDAIRMLKDSDIMVAVMTTLSKDNFRDVTAMVDLLASESVDVFAVDRFIPEGRGKSSASKMLSTEDVQEAFSCIKELSLGEERIKVQTYRPLFVLTDTGNTRIGAMCSIGMSALTIMHDGTILPCRRLPLPIGNVLEGGLLKAWYDSDLLWELRTITNYHGECETCELVPSCRGCRAMAYYVTGDYLAGDPHCWK